MLRFLQDGPFDNGTITERLNFATKIWNYANGLPKNGTRDDIDNFKDLNM